MQIGQAYKRHTAIFTGIHDYARQQGDWRLIIDEWADHTLPGRGSKASPYDGLVGRISAQGARRAHRLGLPVVNVWFNSPARDLSAVFADHEACGRVRAEHLLSRGFRNFGIVYHPPYRASVTEADAFENTVCEAGFACSKVTEGSRDGELDRRNDSYRDWQRSVHVLERWLDSLHPPVGLFIYHIDTARLIIEMCRNRGWRVPEDVAIVAGSNEAICERPEPGVTSLEYPYEQIGFEAARLLDQLMNKSDSLAPNGSGNVNSSSILLPPVGIVARRSTDFRAVDDPLVRSALRFIDENLHRPITIDTLANATNVSRRALTNRFRDKLHRTVAAEIQRLRIERVKRELTATNLPIKQIARQAGFGSPRTMNDAFNAEAGCSPRVYRQRTRQSRTA
ncbi:MAG: substrate-binding domain-containing protein [Planctomycetota bacterium]|nr:substrate-binding domain-containing protein [Planctomycetota bacterium]MDA1164837.1 substrate-binding domain-containing protein [Planctomycetota bacterium]